MSNNFKADFETIVDVLKQNGAQQMDGSSWKVSITGTKWPTRMGLHEEENGVSLTFNGNTIAACDLAGVVEIAKHDPSIASTRRYTEAQSEQTIRTYADVARRTPQRFTRSASAARAA